MQIPLQLRIAVSGLLIALTSPLESTGQERCGTVGYTEILQEKGLGEDIDRFEEWLGRKIEQSSLRTKTLEAPLRVPVVVHVVHKGEPVGTGANVSLEQILSQIEVLNKDFARLNDDAENTPSEFLPVAGSIQLEFVLAKQTPDGQSTDGVIRVKGTKTVWNINDDAALKGSSYWPAEDYLNIWVTDLSSELLGYAQFPISDLPGLDGATDNRLTDGVVIDYKAFGSIDYGDFDLLDSFNKGRAATHEIGHFFGLRHIWGDDDGLCGNSGDYVSDTPDQANSTDGCPAHPYTTCGQHTMFQNYMDYTNDNCMNLFTQGQIGRIEAVLEDSPRRGSLLNSHALADPQPLANDLGIVNILSPRQTECQSSIQPRLAIRNNGTNPVTSASLELSIDGALMETRDFNFNPALEVSDTAELFFNTISEIPPGDYTYEFAITTTNNTDDSKPYDNSREIVTEIPHPVVLPVNQDFSAMPQDWTIENPDDNITWEVRSTSGSTGNAIYLNFFKYRDGEGEEDRLITPWFDLTAAESPYLVFNVAYATFQGRSDGLRIDVLPACSSPGEGIQIYSKKGSALATAEAATSSFVPASDDDWRTEIVDLSDYAGQSAVRVSFTGINDWGNNLYLDNIHIVKGLAENVSITKVVQPSPIHCTTEPTPVLQVKNKGAVIVNTLRIQSTVNQQEMPAQYIDDLNLMPGDVAEITLAAMTLTTGTNTLMFEATLPNDVPDADPDGNEVTIMTVVNTEQDRIPLLENFETNWEERWATINPYGGINWQAISTNYGESLYVDAYGSDATDNDVAWLASPVLDLSQYAEASLSFDLSYRHRENFPDSFTILASTDCGQTYPDTLYSLAGSNLSAVSYTDKWQPAESADWKKGLVNLNAFAGKENVRLAFLFGNARGNNLYLDNIEFYTTDDPLLSVPRKPYTLYGTDPSKGDGPWIAFDLDNRQAVEYELVDLVGRQLSRALLPDVLNQTYQIERPETLNEGIYILRFFIDNRYYAERIYLDK